MSNPKNKKPENVGAPDALDPVEPSISIPEPTETVYVIRKTGGGYAVSEHHVPSSALQAPAWTRAPDSFDGAISSLDLHLTKRFSSNAGGKHQ